MGMKFAIYDKQNDNSFIFENKRRGIGDFIIDLNTYFVSADLPIRIRKYKEGFPERRK